MNLRQYIAAERRVFHCGDLLRIVLELDAPQAGRAFLRTTLGMVDIRYRELIDQVEHGKAIIGRDWQDLPMRRSGERSFELLVPLLAVGSYEGKAFFQPENSERIYWPAGENLRFKVEPEVTVCANTLYTAFIRQFGPNLADCQVTEEEKQAMALLDRRQYTVIPAAGTFRNLIGRLDMIIGELGSRIVQLLPIHPVPTTFARMGRFGSPFAALDYFSVNPTFADFDRKRTPMEQFEELVDAVHLRGGLLFLDIPVNHTGWASRLQLEHPDWFVRRDDGTLESPGAWGVVWEDLCKLDYRRREVWRFMAEVFLFWCRRGVNGFRCDAGYMLPAESWDYIVAKVRREFPATVFLLEGLGGPRDKQEQLLGRSDLNWAYSELFQNYSREQIEYYQPYIARCSAEYGLLVNYAETHDNNRLAVSGPVYASMRCALCALLSEGGGFGITNGVEWFATEKVDVHGDASLNWGNPANQVKGLRRLQTLLAEHAAFAAGNPARLVTRSRTAALAALRGDGDDKVLILINLDCEKSTPVAWPVREFEAPEETALDLLSGGPVHWQRRQEEAELSLMPGQALCLTRSPERLRRLELALTQRRGEPARVRRQRLKAAALRLHCHFHGYDDFTDPALPEQLAEEFFRDHRALLRRLSGLELPPVTEYRVGRDERRNVMVPPGDLVKFTSAIPFQAEIYRGETLLTGGACLPTASGEQVLYLALPELLSDVPAQCEVRLATFVNKGVEHHAGPLLLLPPPERVSIRMRYTEREIGREPFYALASNQVGGMSQAPAEWGALYSKYDALLAGNCNPDYPADRHVMFTRCRAWLVLNDYSQELDRNCLNSFTAGSDNKARWDFSVPVGQGQTVRLRIVLQMALDGDAMELAFIRLTGGMPDDEQLADEIPVKLILRPQLEDRINHQVTKAFAGAESRYPASVSVRPDGFEFSPDPARKLRLILTGNGSFRPEAEWQYMVNLPLEEYYGLEHHTDLFSPGYFSVKLSGGEPCSLRAEIGTPAFPAEYRWPEHKILPSALSPEATAQQALRRFVVKRDQFATVIAGYPWFLDWGRDTLICLRGLIAAGFQKESAAIIKQFAKFEKGGTIPNMIRGNDDSNRNTSDAPLWLFTALEDYLNAWDPDGAILGEDCGAGRSLLEILVSIVDNYRRGTANGIKMDPESALIFSPAHFTWMDTNHPAGSPRQGYPIEIQALWHAALRLIGRYRPEYRPLMVQVRENFQSLFFRADLGRFADCRHADAFLPAAHAVADDAVRPNQLFALTLGLVKDRDSRLAILRSAEELLLPGGIRSLSDRPVSYPLPVYRYGTLLNDPVHPYCGYYRGPEDTSRKVAYHNGTGWTWPFPSYAEGLLLVGGEPVRERARALLLSSKLLFESGTPGQVPEVLDGDWPHRRGGCTAQAWGVTEFFRVLKLLDGVTFSAEKVAAAVKSD